MIVLVGAPHGRDFEADTIVAGTIAVEARSHKGFSVCFKNGS